MIKSITTLACIFFINIAITAQQAVGINSNNPHPSSVLDIVSTDKGVLIPRMDSLSRMAIISPANGLMIYDSSYNAFYYFNGSAWSKVGNSDNLGNHTATQNLNLGNNYLSGDGNNKGLLINTNGDATLSGASQNKLTIGDGSNSVSLSGLKNNAQEWRWALGQTSGNVLTLTDVTHDDVPVKIFPNSSVSLTINGSNIGIGNVSPTEKLDVSGKTKTINFQMTNGANNGYVLQTDGSGNASWVNPLSIKADTMSIIADADNDTKVEVEKTANDNEINFTINDTTFFNMKRGTLEFNNPGNSVYIGNNSGFNDSYIFTTTNNVGVGNNTLSSLNGNSIATIRNTALGTNALQNLNSNSGNSIGNTAIGYNALNAFTGSGNSNVAIGQQAGVNKITGSSNVFLGSTSGANNTNGSGNVFLGNSSGFNETGSNKLYIENSNNSTPLIYGDFSTNKVTINDSLQTKYFILSDGAVDGYVLQSDISGNASWINPSNIKTDTATLIADEDGNTKVEVEQTANDNLIRFTQNGKEYHKMNRGTIEYNNTGGSVYLGNASGNADQFQNPAYNVGIGANTLQFATASGIGYSLGTENIAIGRRSMQFNSLGYKNLGIGNETLRNLSSGNFNNALGHKAGEYLTTGSGNTLLGSSTGSSLTTGSDNVFLGNSAGYYETGSNKLYISNSGTQTPLIYGDFSTKKLNINDSLQTKYLTLTQGAIDGYVLQSDANGNSSWVDPYTLSISETDPQVISTTANYIPKWNGVALADGLIYDSGTYIGIGTSNPSEKLHVVGSTRIDGGRLDFRNIGQSVFIGESAGLNDDLTNNQNVFMGYEAGKANINGNLNAFIGHEAGNDNTTGSANTALGQAALKLNTTGGNNTAIGRGSLLNLNGGIQNTIVGNQAFQLSTAGNHNVALGFAAGQNNLTGERNVFLGYSAGYDETGSNKLYITNTPDTSPLIYGEFDNDLLRINGTLNINNAYSLPTTDGTANYILQTNGTGTASWVNPSTLSNSNWITSGSDQYSALSGNVGIGTNTPSYKLDVQNTSNVTANIQSSTANAYLALAAPASSENAISLKNNASGTLTNRWVFGKTNSAEAGSDVGSDFYINRYSDAGTYLGQPLVIKRNTGNVGVGTTSPSDKLHVVGNIRVDAGRIDFQNTGSSVFIGQNAGAVDDLGSNLNVFIGTNSGSLNYTGRFNTYIGDGSGKVNDIGNFNTAIGQAALEANIGGNNSTAIGRYALGGNVNGYENTALGTNAGGSNNGNKNVFIGYAAGQNEAGSEKLYIDNTNTSTPLIYGDFLSNYVDINGSLGVKNGNSSFSSTKNQITFGFNNTSNFRHAIKTRHNSGGLEYNAIDFYLWDYDNDTADVVGTKHLMTLEGHGRVGIGTTSPTQAKLVVNGSTNTNIGNYGYLNSAGNTNTSSGNNDYSIYASSRIAATEFNAFSDARIKNITSRTNTTTDLATLANIQITNYTHIDTIAKGNKEIKKVIAQELKAVYPQAVSTMTDVIPNIYKQAELNAEGFVNLPTTLKVGDQVKIIFSNDEKLVSVTSVTEKGFSIDKDQGNAGKIFVYGKQVSDFHVVDYEALSSLNISATQELLKKIEDLEKANLKLVADIEFLKNQVSKIETLEKQMQMLLQNGESNKQLLSLNK